MTSIVKIKTTEGNHIQNKMIIVVYKYQLNYLIKSYKLIIKKCNKNL